MKIKRILLLLLLLVPLVGVLCMSTAGAISDLSAAPVLPILITSPLGDMWGEPSSVSTVGQATDFTSIPAIFIKNNGQFRDDVLYSAVSDAGPIYFTKDGSVIRLGDLDKGTLTVVGFTYPGVSGDSVVEGVDSLPCKVNFLLGSDQADWVTNIDTYRAVKYVDLYPGIDLTYEGSDDGIKSTYNVRPGASPENINIKYYGHEGLSIATDGTLVIMTRAGIMTQSAPYCYQIVNGNVVEVSSSYVLIGQDQVGFAIGEYDPDLDLIIDPVLMKYGLYFRGIGMGSANSVTVDAKRNAYVTGTSFPAPYEIPDSINGSNFGGTDVIVVKINPDGTVPLYITYLGGNGDDAGYGIRVDGVGNAYITGTTNSTNFPTVNPLQAALAGKQDAFISKLSPNGTPLVYSTYLGGTGDDYSYAIALDSINNAYITGYTDSPNFPIFSTVHRTTRNGLSDAYAVKVRSDGQELLYAEYIGGNVMETGYGIAVDSNGFAYVTGQTFSFQGFPTKNAFNPNFSGYSDAFLTKVAPSGDPFVYSTYFGGSDMDAGKAIAVDNEGYAYITGITKSNNFPVKDAFKPVSPGLICSFYSRFEPSGKALSYSTYLTGPGYDEGRGITVTPSGSVYVTGITKADHLQLYDPFQPKYGGGVSDAFVAKFTNGQVFPAYLTYLGGSDKDEAYAIATDNICGAYIVGLTRSMDFPTVDPYSVNFTPKGTGGFIALLADCNCTPPIANFIANKTNGTAPLAVQFIDTSTGSPTSWLWEFGDGVTSQSQNSSHTYTEVGTYTVNLTITNDCGSDTLSKPEYIEVLPCPLPVANFTANQTNGTAPLYVQFTDESTNAPTSWLWEFGDNVTSTTQNPVHTYNETGTYRVNLTVTNDCGSDTISRPEYVEVIPCPLPVANFSANQTNGTAPLSVQFTDSSTGSPTSWSWEFGDGETSQSQNPSHIYTQTGNYTVNLTVTNDCGADILSRPEYIHVVTCPPPIANFSANRTNGIVPLSVQFTDISTGSPTSWSWEFGDGATSQSQNPSHTYTQPGAYTVNLTVTNDCGSNTISRPEYIVVCPCLPPVAKFTASPTSGNVPLTVEFTDTSTGNPTSWSWEFGDGETSQSQNPSHTYTQAGNYTVNLTVTNNCASDTVSDYIHVSPCPPPVANFIASPPSGTAPVTIEFTDTSIGNPTSWSWEFGDGETSQSQNPSHTYTQSGTYTVNLTVTNNCGSDTISRPICIHGCPCPPPEANFIASPTSGTAPLTVQFTDISTGNPTFWSWEFGDGATSQSQNPSHTYTNPGTYTVNLTVTNDCGADTISRPEYITVLPCPLPVASFTANPMSGYAPLEVLFTDTSTGSPTSWLWEFGDGATSQSQNPSHIYTEIGTYRVNFTVTNDCGSNTVSEYIQICPCPLPVASFIANPNSGTAPLTVEFTDTSTGDPTSWSWEFGDGTTSLSRNPSHTYTELGTYRVKLTVTNDCGSDITSNYIEVCPCPLPPFAHFSANCTTGPAPLVVQFTDESENFPTSWFWDFGDNTSSTTRNPVHKYIFEGVYTVKLTVTNAAGSDSLSKSGFIIVTEPIPQSPIAQFSANQTSGHVPLTVQFTDESENYPNSWLWDFGDNTTSDISNPIHTYYTVGSYTVNLTVSNVEGTDSESKSGFIEVTQPDNTQTPVADFGSNVTVGFVPLTVQFTDLSTGDPVSWTWDFGDTTNSTSENPLHTYVNTGFYTVTLTVENSAGENTTAKNNYINVKPMTGGETGYFVVHSNVEGADVYFDEDFKGVIENGTLLVQVYIAGTPYGEFSVIANGYYPFVEPIIDYPGGNETIHLYATLSPVNFYYINASSAVEGVIVPSGLIEVVPRSNITFNITAISGYATQNVLIDGDGKGALGTYTFVNVTANHTIFASSFRKITAGGGGGGGGGGYSVPTTIPTTIPSGGTAELYSGEGGTVVTTQTTEVTEVPTIEMNVTTPVPLTTVPPAQPFFARFPLAWMIPVTLLIIILAGLAYYYYQKEKGEELFEKK